MVAPGKEKKELAKESSELYQLMSSTTSTYSVDDRLNAVMLFVTEGNMKKVEKLTGVPYVTLISWKEQEWWPKALQFCHKRKDKELELRFSRLINDAVSEIHDRVVNGDVKVSKDGNKTRQPMSGRDLAAVLNIVHDKRQLLRGEATALVASKDNQTDKLKALEEKFNEFSAQLKAKTIDAEVITV